METKTGDKIIKRKLVQILKALANEKRLKLLDVIKKNPEASICEISRVANINYKTTSAYLRKLAAAGIIIFSANKSRIRGGVNKNVKEVIRAIQLFDRRK